MKYMIVEKKTNRELGVAVETYTDIGWRLQGGVSVSVSWYKNKPRVYYAQVMVLGEEEDA